MGRRREGFLTQWQWDYITGKNEISKTRKRIEDYYIFRSWEKTIEQYLDFVSWCKKRGKQMEPLPYEFVAKNMIPVRGKKKGKLRLFKGKGICPACGHEIFWPILVDKQMKKVDEAQYSTFGLERTRKES